MTSFIGGVGCSRVPRSLTGGSMRPPCATVPPWLARGPLLLARLLGATVAVVTSAIVTLRCSTGVGHWDGLSTPYLPPSPSHSGGPRALQTLSPQGSRSLRYHYLLFKTRPRARRGMTPTRLVRPRPTVQQSRATGRDCGIRILSGR
jgi:hypothetical protein